MSLHLETTLDVSHTLESGDPVLKLGNVQIAYPQLLMPDQIYGKDAAPKYGIVVLIPKTSGIKEMLETEVIAKLARDRIGRSPYETFFRDGDDQRGLNNQPVANPKSFYEGHWTTKMKNGAQPILADEGGNTLEDSERGRVSFYSGVIVNVFFSISFFIPKAPGSSPNKHLCTFRLLLVQKRADADQFTSQAKVDKSKFKLENYAGDSSGKFNLSGGSGKMPPTFNLSDSQPAAAPQVVKPAFDFSEY